MSGSAERLAYMANQIARNLAVRGEDMAIAETAAHITAFWDPRMKAMLLALDDAMFDPIAAHAVHLIRDRGGLRLSPATEIGVSDAG